MTERRVIPLQWKQMRQGGTGQTVDVWCAFCSALQKQFYAESERRIQRVEAMRSEQVLAAFDRITAALEPLDMGAGE